ncbi:hypothetical protein DL766_008819 [Monosporascus sp. MC13-8B]|nr:hypothetical protein DL766_008819 [Monosporascus sp. MC13-8B]
MAVIKEIPGLKAQIVDAKDVPLKEYDDPYAEEPDEELQLLATATKEDNNISVHAQKIPHVIKYIEAISGAEFSFEFIKFPNFEHRSHHLAFRCVFDGLQLLPAHEPDEEREQNLMWFRVVSSALFKGPDGRHFYHAFKFGDLQKGKFLGWRAHEVKRLGTLQILVYNMMFSNETYTPAICARPSTGPVHEKALKGRTVSHKVDYSPGKPCIPSPGQVGVYQDPLKRPFAVFEFRYRSREDLIAEGIVPRPTPIDDMDEQQLRQFALKLYREKEDRDKSVKREVKTERETQGGVKRSREGSELTPAKRSKGSRSPEIVDLTEGD